LSAFGNPKRKSARSAGKREKAPSVIIRRFVTRTDHIERRFRQAKQQQEKALCKQGISRKSASQAKQAIGKGALKARHITEKRFRHAKQK
jgi:hypothetical protein